MLELSGRGIVSDVYRNRGLVCIVVQQGVLRVGDTLHFTNRVGEPPRDEQQSLKVSSLRWQDFSVEEVKANSTGEVSVGAFGTALPACESEVIWRSVSDKSPLGFQADTDPETAIGAIVDNDGAV